MSITWTADCSSSMVSQKEGGRKECRRLFLGMLYSASSNGTGKGKGEREDGAKDCESNL